MNHRFSSLKILFLFCVTVILSSCETTFGVYRTANLHSMPSSFCLEEAIRSVPEVDNVRVVSYRDANHRDVLNISYSGRDGSEIGGQILVKNFGNYAEFSNLAITSIPPVDSYIQSTRPVMILVERSIIDICSIQELNSIAEQCKEANCPPLD